jgi:hypothetical protein
MKKRGVLVGFFVIFSTFLINFVSAQFYGRGFSITGFIDSIGPENLFFMASFIVFFVLFFYALGKVFKDSYGYPNKPIAGTIALVGAFMASYGLHRSGFDLAGFFYGTGIDTGLLYPILAIIFLVFAIFIIRYIKLSGFLMLLGAFFLAIALFTDIVYEDTFLGIIGAILLLVGFFVWRRSMAKKLGKLGKYVLKGAGYAGKGIGRLGKKSYRGARTAKQKYGQYRYDRMHEMAIEENKRRDYLLKGMKQIAKKMNVIQTEIANLQKQIPKASVAERGKIEGQIKKHYRQGKKLEKRYSVLEREYNKIGS